MFGVGLISSQISKLNNLIIVYYNFKINSRYFSRYNIIIFFSSPFALVLPSPLTSLFSVFSEIPL